jgi:hypothetical protein
LRCLAALQWHGRSLRMHSRLWQGDTPEGWFRYSAFTVAELGEMLPKIDGRGWIQTIHFPRFWSCDFKGNTYLTKHSAQAITEADARAKMLIYFLENKLIPTT